MDPARTGHPRPFTPRVATPQSIENGRALDAFLRARRIPFPIFARLLDVQRGAVYAWAKGLCPTRRNAAKIEAITDGEVSVRGWG